MPKFDTSTVNFAKLIARFIISVLVLCVSLWGVFFSTAIGATEKQFAAGLIGTIVGYWIK